MDDNNKSYETIEELRDEIYADSDNGYGDSSAELNTEGNSDDSNTAVEVATNDNVETAEEQPAEDAVHTDAKETGTSPETGTSETPSYEQAMSAAAILDRARELEKEVVSLRAQLADANGAARANAEAAQQNVAEQLSDISIPEWDAEAYAYANDEDRAAMFGDFIKKVVSATRDGVMREISPLIEQRRVQEANAAFEKAIGDIAALEDFKGFDVNGLKEDIHRIGNLPEFRNMPDNQRYAHAALIARGLAAASPAASPAAPAGPELDINAKADAIFADAELMKAIEARRISAAQNAAGNIPVHSATGSLSSAAHTAPKKPQTMEELQHLYGAY